MLQKQLKSCCDENLLMFSCVTVGAKLSSLKKQYASCIASTSELHSADLPCRHTSIPVPSRNAANAHHKCLPYFTCIQHIHSIFRARPQSKVHTHSPGSHVEQTSDTSHSQPNPPKPVGVDVLHNVLRILTLEAHLPVQRHLCSVQIQPTLGLRAAGRRSGRRRVQSRCREHLRWAESEEHGVYGRAVEFEQVQARDVVIRVGEGFVAL